MKINSLQGYRLPYVHDDKPRVFGELKAENIEGALQIQKTPLLGLDKERRGDGTIMVTSELTHEAYQMLKDAGYSDDNLVFDLGRRPKEYGDSKSLPKFEYNWNSADDLLNSIFDRIYRGSDYPDRTDYYTKIILNLQPPQTPTPSKASAEVSQPKEDLLGVGYVVDLSQRYSASSRSHFDHNPPSGGNYWHMGQRANVEGAYHSAINPTAYVPIGYMIRPDDYDHDFLYISNDFFAEYATKLANSEDDKDLNNRVWHYSERALEYFGGYNNEYKDGTLVSTGESITARVYLHHSDEQIRPVYDQLTAAINEYAQLIKKGDANISQVKSKITIGDMEFSLSELVKTHDFLSKVISSADHTSGDVKYYASTGLAVAAVNQFAANELSPETAKKVSAMFEKRVEDSFVSRNDWSTPAKKAVRDAVENLASERRKTHPPQFNVGTWNRSVEESNYFDTRNGDITDKTFNSGAYFKFKEISGNNSRAIDNAYKEAMKWMEQEFGAWYDYMGHTSDVKAENFEKMKQQLYEIYNRIF